MRRLLWAFIIIAAVVAAPVSAATVDGLKIHASVTGTGTRTIVFVHGWTCDASSWAAQVSAFDKTHRVITLDLPGHGRSDSPKDGRFSMDLFARAVEAVRAEANAEKIVLVGHSMGAPVIRQYARLFPGRVAALVAVDGPLDIRGFPPPQAGQAPPPMTGPEGLEAREAMIRGMFTKDTPAALQQQVLKMMLDTPEATAAGAMAAVFDPALRTSDVLPMPALAVFAGTAQVPDEAVTRQVLPDYEAAQIAGTGHFLMMEKPDEFNRLLAAFLDRIESR